MPATRPNLLLLFPDQLRADWTGLRFDLPLRTPHLARLAECGTRFTAAITPSPLCAPARAILATGLDYADCRVPGNDVDLPADTATFYQELRRAGYQVLGCGKFDLAKNARGWRIDGSSRLAQWGFTGGCDSEGKWDGVASGREAPAGPFLAMLERRGLRQAYLADMERRRAVGPGAAFPCPLPDDAYGDNWVAANGLNLLAAVPAGQPWFLQVNFPGPHDPWDVTAEMADRYPAAGWPEPVAGDPRLTAAEHQAVRRNYAAMIDNLDRAVGRFLALLEQRGELERTLIVFSSDHGEHLGDHGRWGKSTPHGVSVDVPLLCAGPGVARGHTVAAPATLLDLPATFLDAAGVPVPAHYQSRSLSAALAGGASSRQFVQSGLQRWRLVRDARYKLVRTGYATARQPAAPGAEQLYDLQADPHELHDLAADPAHQATRARLGALLPPR